MIIKKNYPTLGIAIILNENNTYDIVSTLTKYNNGEPTIINKGFQSFNDAEQYIMKGITTESLNHSDKKILHE
jgi:hypothetical protein